MMNRAPLAMVMLLAACPSDDPPMIDALIEPPSQSFATHVHPLMLQAGCPGCHTVGEPGYDMSEVRGGVKADFAGTAEEVRAVLLAGATASCASMPARVCLPDPEASLFYTKPLMETGASDHSGISFPASSNIIHVIIGWIRQGAQP